MCGAHALCCTWCVYIVQYGLLAAPPTLWWARHACCWPVAAVRVHPVPVLVSVGCCSQAGLLSAPTTVYPQQSLVTVLLKHDGRSRGMGKIVRRWQQVGGAPVLRLAGEDGTAGTAWHRVCISAWDFAVIALFLLPCCLMHDPYGGFQCWQSNLWGCRTARCVSSPSVGQGVVRSFVCGEVLPATAVVMYSSSCCVLGRINLADVFVLQSESF
jgi:hypothetical protein